MPCTLPLPHVIQYSVWLIWLDLRYPETLCKDKSIIFSSWWTFLGVIMILEFQDHKQISVARSFFYLHVTEVTRLILSYCSLPWLYCYVSDIHNSYKILKYWYLNILIYNYILIHDFSDHFHSTTYKSLWLRIVLKATDLFLWHITINLHVYSYKYSK